MLWPENVVDVNDVPFVDSEAFDAIAAEAARLGVPLAVGVTEDADQTGRGEPGQITNAQVVVTPDGQVTSRYDKVRRVPFGEYVPLRGLLEALGAPVDQVRTDAVPGTGPAVIEMPDGTKIAVVISWEVFFAGRAREGVKTGRGVHRQPDERRQLLGNRAPDPTSRIEPAARRRNRSLGRPGRADGLLRVRVAFRRRRSAHGRERARRHRPGDRPAHRLRRGT